MPPTFQLLRPKRFEKLTPLLRIRGVSVYFHWSVLLIAAVILANAVSKPWTSIAALFSYLGMILLHEVGHLYAAQRLGCRVHSISLYPFHGRCEFETPWSKFDHCVIAWGGVIAQAAVFVPVVLWVIIVGYTPFEPINAMLAILGGISMVIAGFNLLPSAGLDGHTAWAIIPEFLRQRRLRSVHHR
jgi:stage IV sporulation protein FB